MPNSPINKCGTAALGCERPEETGIAVLGTRAGGFPRLPRTIFQRAAKGRKYKRDGPEQLWYREGPRGIKPSAQGVSTFPPWLVAVAGLRYKSYEPGDYSHTVIEDSVLKIAYFDCFCGAGGDMIVASLLDAGASKERLETLFESMGLSGYSLHIEKIAKRGFSATRFVVELDEEARQPVRNLEAVLKILSAGELSEKVRLKATAIFERLAAAEAKVHGTSIDKIHFHEVGAVDAILDVVGAVFCLEDLGVEEVVCSPIVTGSGTVRCAHGLLPVPAPATAELLKGVPILAGDEEGEFATPTAAAVLTTLSDRFCPLPPMRNESVGYGAGQREAREAPNVLRVFIGSVEAGEEADSVTVLETTIDDATPEVIGHCLERLLKEGVLEAYAMPIYMKKSRPGVLVTALCDHGRADDFERIIFAETTTFGIRRHRVGRVKLRRRHEEVETPFGKVRVKIGERDGVVVASPEYEDCLAVAVRHGVALREVMEAARAAWRVR